MTIAYRFMHRHTRNTLVARGWPANMDIDTSLNYSRGEGVAILWPAGCFTVAPTVT